MTDGDCNPVMTQCSFRVVARDTSNGWGGSKGNRRAEIVKGYERDCGGLL